MRQIGISNSARRRRSAKIKKLPSRIQSFGNVNVSGVTTPAISLSGSVRATPILLILDPNDFTGFERDFSITSATVNNQTDGTSASGQTFNFTANLGQIGSGHFLSTGNNNFESLVGAGSGDTIVVTGDLTLAGYESTEVTASITY
tara:strand:- start:16 stop:453 length:438 start_codon:yes stop_codon:yes gene_type:complete